MSQSSTQTSCGIENTADNAGDTPTLWCALKDTAHGAECRAGRLPARFECTLLSWSTGIGRGDSRGLTTLFLLRISARAGENGSTLGLVGRAGLADDLLPLTLPLLV